MANYKTEAEALAAAGAPGWTVTGREPEFENVSGRDENNQPTTTKQRTGNTVLTVQSPDGKRRDTITVGSADDPEVKGGKTITVVKGAQTQLPTSNQSSQPSGWTPVYRTPDKPESGQIGQWDPVNNEFHPQTAEPNAKPSGTYDNVSVNGRVVGIADKGDGSFHPISTTADGKQVVTTPTAIYSFDKDSNALTKLADVDAKSPFQAVIVGGKVYKFDPKDGSLTLGASDEHPDIKDANGNPMTWQGQADGSGKYGYPPGVSPAATVGNSTTLKELVWYDNQGNEVSRKPNPNYVETPAQAPSPNTVAPYIQIPDPQHPSQLIWVENKGQVTASQALKDLASHLTGQVVDGKISVDEAKTLIEASNQRMTAETQQAQNAATAAQTVISAQNQGAQTGAGLLQNRVSAGQGMLGSILGLAGQRPMVGLPGNAGQMIMSDIQGMTAQLGGGQGVYDTAARLVQAADPQGGRSPEAAQAYGVIAQMLQKYQDQNNAPHPTVTATQALQQSQQSNGMAAPATTPAQRTPAVPVQQPAVASGVMAPVAQVPGQNYGAATAYTGGVPPWQQGWTAPGANYSYPGPAPWAAPPGPSFTAPPMPGPLTPQMVMGR